MKNYSLFLIVLLAFLSACATAPVSAAASPVTVTYLPTATQIVPAPSANPTSTCNSAAQTPAPQAPSAGAALTETCIGIEQEMPNDLPLSGVWVINEANPYLEKLDDHMVYGVPLKGGGLLSARPGDMAISPDGTHMAYIDNYFDANHRMEKRILRVIRSSGHSLDMSFWVQNWQWLIGWIDNENLALATTKGNVEILNPITGNWREVQQPKWLTADNFTYWNIPMYNPTLEWIVSQQDYQDVVLRNVKTGEIAWQSKDIGWSDVSWGSQSSIMAVSAEKSIIVIHDNLQEEKFDMGALGYDYFSDEKLSPDGQKLAFNSSQGYQHKPTVLDFKNHKVIKLCTDDYQTWNTPIWSPDSRFVIEQIYNSHYESFDVLIDTQQMHAYLLKSGYFQHRIAWLAQP